MILSNTLTTIQSLLQVYNFALLSGISLSAKDIDFSLQKYNNLLKFYVFFG